MGAVQELLSKAVAELEDKVSGVFVTRTQYAYRELEKAENPHGAGAAAATKFLRQTDALEKKLEVYPGKAIFGKLVDHLQTAHRLNLRIEDVIAGDDSRERAGGTPTVSASPGVARQAG